MRYSASIVNQDTPLADRTTVGTLDEIVALVRAMPVRCCARVSSISPVLGGLWVDTVGRSSDGRLYRAWTLPRDGAEWRAALGALP